MTRTVEITVYQFDELDQSAQDAIVSRWRNNDQFPWSDEWRESLDAFAKLAPITVRDWSIGYRDTYVTFDMEDDIADLSGNRARTWLVNNGWQRLAQGQDCPFTGYCGDETLLDAIRNALANPASIVSLQSVFDDALQDWARGFEADLEYWHSEEAIREDIEANGYEFLANGDLA